ncbi:MAG: hypothetical protein KBC84_08765 [Proteobacteria bacterium]|nr:hypothetical protein [Pseudomonadota bacterium]
MVNFNVFMAKAMNRLFLAHSAAAVLQGSKNGCWIVMETDKLLVRLKLRFSK